MSKKIYLGKLGGWLVLAICTILIYTLFSNYSDNFFIAINLARTYAIPMLVYFITVNLKISWEQVRKLLNIIVYLAAVTSVYGLFQAFVLGDSFLVKIGYPNINGQLNSSYYIGRFFGHQRVVGTFVSANICGVFFAIGLLILLFSEMSYKKKFIVGGCITAGLLGTLSRSSITGVFIAILFYIFKLKKRSKVSINKIIKILLALIVIAAVLLIIDHHMLDGLIFQMLSSTTQGAISLSDSSAQKHLEDLYLPLIKIFNHPFGLGFGNNGPIAYEHYSSANLVESSFYLLMYDFGILGGIIFLYPYFRVIYDTYKNCKLEFPLPSVVSIMILVTYALLPNIQTYEILFFFYMMLGLYYNKGLRSN